MKYKTKRSKIIILFKKVALVIFMMIFSEFVQAKNEFRFLVKSDNSFKVWWTGSTCKVMRDDPVPERKGRVFLQAARNENESFQLVICPLENMEGITVTVSDFRNKKSHIISSENVTIRNVEYVRVTKPSGKLHQTGLYPDPLPLYDKPFNAGAGVNTPVLFTIKTTEDTAPGVYSGHINLKSTSWETSIPVEIEIRDFVLPAIPFMRSAFGLYSGMIRQYHNLADNEELKQVLDLYYHSFKEYRISPQSFYDLCPIRKTLEGVWWTGGTFDPDVVFEGKYSYQVTGSATGTHTELIKIVPGKPYWLKWWAKTRKDNRKYYVTVKSYTNDQKPINWHLQGMFYTGSTQWRKDSLFLDPVNPLIFEDMVLSRPIPQEAAYVSVQLFPVPNESGEERGTVWFDNFQFVELSTGNNLLPQGSFEQDIDQLNVKLDFTEFDVAARKYLDEFGFTGFRIRIPELRSGPYFGRKTGWFNGFINGTDEYKKLIGLYLKGLQDHLEVNGWLGKEYLYWVDEPKQEDYNFVREGMMTIHEAAPKLTRLITENNPGPEIMDVTEVGCPVLARLNPEESKKWIAKERQMWSYLMTWPKAPHVNLFIDSDAINMRIWLWMSYRYQLTGILVWSSNFWNTEGCSPSGILQNVWEDPMTYMEKPEIPVGAGAEYGNGDGRFFYPPNRDPNHDKTKYLSGPVPSLRLEILREGIDDYDYLVLLENAIKNARPDQQNWVKKAKQVLNFGAEVFINDQEYNNNPEILMKYRREIGDLLEQLNARP